MPPTAIKNQPDVHNHLGFLFSEEEALKTWLTGIKVPSVVSGGAAIDVGCWFRYPEGERQLKYPFIVIDMLTVEPDYDLFTSTYYQDPVSPQPLYVPSTSPHLPTSLPTAKNYSIREYLSFRIIWQISHYARSNIHDRYLTSIFNTSILPVRPFFIYNAADGVDRRTDRLGFQAADTMESTESGTKRIFRKIYTVSMLTDVAQTDFANEAEYAKYQALQVLLRGEVKDEPGNYWTGDEASEHWEVIAPYPPPGPP